MATQTTNYGLTKPSYNETADIGVINSNMDIIDAKMKENADNVSTLATEVDEIKSDVVHYEQSGYLSKNLLNPTLQTITRSGITCTNNGDGTYTLNGTCTEATNIGKICIIGKSFPMDLRFLGVPNGCNSYLAIGIEGENNKTINNGRSVLIQANKKIIQVDFWINQGDTLDNVVFKPMLTTDLNATYDDFTPYAPSNTELQCSKADNSVVSDAWDASTTYAVGQYCIYNNSLWKCLVQHSEQTPSEGTYWTNVSVANEIASLNSSLSSYIITKNYAWSGSINANSKIDINEDVSSYISDGYMLFSAHCRYTGNEDVVCIDIFKNGNTSIRFRLRNFGLKDISNLNASFILILVKVI